MTDERYRELVEKIREWEAARSDRYMREEEFPDCLSALEVSSVRRLVTYGKSAKVRSLARSLKITTSELRECVRIMVEKNEEEVK